MFWAWLLNAFGLPGLVFVVSMVPIIVIRLVSLSKHGGPARSHRIPDAHRKSQPDLDLAKTDLMHDPAEWIAEGERKGEAQFNAEHGIAQPWDKYKYAAPRQPNPHPLAKVDAEHLLAELTRRSLFRHHGEEYGIVQHRRHYTMTTYEDTHYAPGREFSAPFGDEVREFSTGETVCRVPMGEQTSNGIVEIVRTLGHTIDVVSANGKLVERVADTPANMDIIMDRFGERGALRDMRAAARPMDMG